ncbi:RadC family protein [Phenylobacterium sp. J367]|uniref:JAB domain-containing protein n=1 Tax=Phenylobacterium sp. J367 TaxID=2898435 RepID=UPI002151634D|nr:DNA repair protein RadC [Phenylobacterium sp. J367]MCR5879447.1 DNA repair protein RadC [Phenylobacterium sp. J367]
MARSHPETAEAFARLLAAGPAALDDREALQIAGGLTPAQAAGLLARFGSLPEVLAAAHASLAREVGAARAARLCLAQDLAGRLLIAPLRRRPVLGGWDAVTGYLRAMLAGRSREQLLGLFLDKRNRLILQEVLGEGTIDHVPVYPREVVRRALELDAAAVVLAHNHPGGLETPSAAEVDATRQVQEAGRVLRIAVHDHFLVAGESVVSYRALGLL